jgi:hypothetical protein
LVELQTKLIALIIHRDEKGEMVLYQQFLVAVWTQVVQLSN